MALAENLVQGVDVWINTPRRPWEASGTSGMKVLVNGGLNLSELDGWWAEAYAPDVGWAIGDGREHFEPGWDAAETEQLFALLEQQVVPEFYDRDADGIPRAWVARIRASLVAPHAALQQQPHAGGVPRAAVPAGRGQLPPPHRATTCASRASCGSGCSELHHHWPGIHWGNLEVATAGDRHVFRVQVYLGELGAGLGAASSCTPSRARVRLPSAMPLRRDHALSGAAGGYLYVGRACPTDRPAGDYTPRVVPAHAEAMIPAEARFIRWYPA